MYLFMPPKELCHSSAEMIKIYEILVYRKNTLKVPTLVVFCRIVFPQV